MRALHWAKRKDASLSSKLKKHSLEKYGEKKLVTSQTRVQKKATGVTYSEWPCRKGASTSKVSTPIACAKQKEVQGSSDKKSLTCTTCTKATSGLVSGSVPNSCSSQLAYPIRINPHQETRNVESIGKPDKLYPYTNYPPARLRSAHSEEQSRKANTLKSGRSSKATFHSSNYSSLLMLSGKKSHTKARKTPVNIKTVLGDLDQTSCSKTYLDETDCCKTESVSSVEAGLELNNECKQKSLAGEAGFTDQTENYENMWSMSDDLNDYCTEEDDEDLLFHDVGNTNNLDALALPDTLTRDKTPAEVIQLLRSIGGGGGTASRSFKRSQSMITKRNLIQPGNCTRRQSLSAIPEGRMVTSYSDEECSTSQLLDEEFVEVLLRNLSRNWETDIDQQEETTVEQAHTVSEEIESSPKDCITSDKQVSPEKRSSPTDNQLNRNPTAHILNTEAFVSLKPTGSRQTPAKIHVHQNCRSSQAFSDQDPKTLKIVNIAWDPNSDNVQSTISLCPLTPPPDSRNRKLPLHILGPRPTLKKSSPQKKHLQFSKETRQKAKPISGSPVPLSSPSPLQVEQVEGEDSYLDSSLPSPLSSKSFFTPVPFHPKSDNDPDTHCHTSKSLVQRNTDIDKQDGSGLKRVMSAPEMRRLS